MNKLEELKKIVLKQKDHLKTLKPDKTGLYNPIRQQAYLEAAESFLEWILEEIKKLEN